jgi:hypothetical protein
MGQEASVLADGRGGDGIDTNSLEEQARAPPSAVHPPSTSAALSATTATLSPIRDTGKPRKLINGIPSMFQRGLIGNKDPPHSHDTESFEQREAARAAAAGGNLYYGPSSSESLLDENDNLGYSSLQKLPPHNAAATSEHHQALQASASMFSLGGHDAAAAAADTPIDAGTRTAIPDKKSIFSGRASARGMINSMRNLSIGSALQRSKPKEVHDWEKQWDEDDDDSDDGGHDTGTASTAAASGLRPGGGGGGLESGHKNAIPPPPPPPLPPPPTSHHLPPLPPSHHSFLVGASATPSAAGTAPKSPIRHDTLYYATPPPPPPLQSTAVGLLSSTAPPPSLVTPPPPQYPYATPHPQQQHSSGQLDVWETDASLPLAPPHPYDVRKPDVDMFLPVLRVLGKGSFGKVRVVLVGILERRPTVYGSLKCPWLAQ